MPVKIFCCSAHEDEFLLNKLKSHLRPLQRQGLINVWYDRDTSAGTEWEREISEQLNTAQIILLLVSPDFMDSDYCYSVETKQALELHEAGKACVIPIILRPVYWQGAPFGRLQALPKDAKPVTSWSDQDEAFFDIAEGIRNKVNELSANMLLAEKKNKQLAIDKLERKITQAGIADDGLVIAATDTTNQHSPIASRASNVFFVKCLCPACSKEFHPGDCDIVSRLTQGKILKLAPRTRIERLRYRLNPEPLTGPEYTQELACRQCPNCGYLLPYNIEIAQNISIVIIGDTYSGISTYLVALLHEIQEKWVLNNKNHIQLSCSTKDIEREFHQDLTHMLFQEKHLLAATQTVVSGDARPLIYELKVNESPSQPTRTINLIFYHGAGEDYGDLGRLLRVSRYVLNANGIIYLADPTSMPEIHRQLPGSYPPRASSNVLSQLIPLFMRQFGMGSESPFSSIPIAITLSKSDLLKYLVYSNKPYYFLSSPKNGYSGSIDLQDLQTVDTEVRKLIYDHGDRMLLQIARGLKAQFFAVSATGYPPDSNGNYPSIEPHRCLDPFLWILYQLGIINADG